MKCHKRFRIIALYQKWPLTKVLRIDTPMHEHMRRKTGFRYKDASYVVLASTKDAMEGRVLSLIASCSKKKKKEKRGREGSHLIVPFEVSVTEDCYKSNIY